MSNNPIDPAAESVNQSDRETSTYDGQEGYGVNYEDGQYSEGTTSDAGAPVRNGSFETNNTGGYGNNQSDADLVEGTTGSGGNPPDPEAGVGQGGQ